MANTHENLTSLFTDIANAIREKTGSTETLVADQFPAAIANIKAGGDVIIAGIDADKSCSAEIEGLGSTATYVIVTTSSCGSWSHMGVYVHLLDKGVLTALTGKVYYNGTNPTVHESVDGRWTFSGGTLSYYYAYSNRTTEVTLTAIQIA
jgi:hypothetical protein